MGVKYRNVSSESQEGSLTNRANQSRCGRAVILSAMLCGVASPALAQPQPDQPTADASAATQPSADEGVGDIVITAERRTQNLQDVSISATVLTGNDLSERGVTEVHDLQQVAPSLAINTYNRSVFVNIRGVGIAQSAPTSNPGVAFYIDGQLVPHEFFIGQGFYDIGSLEVLRGPQGTLTGQNSTGGAIYIRSTAPEFDSFSGSLDASAGNYNAFRWVAAVGAGDDIGAVRVAYLHDQRDSYTRNIGPSGTTPGNSNTDSIRVNIGLRSRDDTFHFNLRGEYFNTDTDNNAVKNRADLVTRNPRVIEEDAISFLRTRGYRISGEATWEFVPGIQARGLVSVQNGQVRDQVDGDRTATAPAIPAGLPASAANRALFPGRVGLNLTDVRTFIGEANLMSTGHRRFNWVVGGFYMNDDVLVDLFRDNHNRRTFVASDATISLDALNESKSVFGQVNFFASDVIELVAGARYSWDSQDLVIHQVQGPVLNPAPVNSTSSSQLTGRLAVNLHLNNNLMLYGTASRGYKAGGNNSTPGQAPYTPETNTVYEAGVKSTMLGRHLRANLSVFYSDYRDIQLLSTITLPITQNVPSGHAYGAELELTAHFGGFTGSLGGSYLHAEFGQAACLTNSGSRPAPIPDPCPGVDQEVPRGRTLPFSPKWTINAGAAYEIPLNSSEMALTPRVQWSHLSSQFATPFPAVDTIVPGRDVFDARLTWRINRRYSIEAFVDNFTNETYVASQVQNATSAIGGIIYGAPRTYGMRAIVNFGS
jgi:iron complex outermembrane receptor protein